MTVYERLAACRSDEYRERIEMRVIEYGNPDASLVLIQPVDEQDLSVIENEVKEIERLSEKDFHLLAVRINNWNHDLQIFTFNFNHLSNFYPNILSAY